MVRERIFPNALHASAIVRADAGDELRISRADHAADDRAGGDVSSACRDGGGRVAFADSGLRRSRVAGRNPAQQTPILVAAAGGAAVFSATDRAGLGTL